MHRCTFAPLHGGTPMPRLVHAVLMVSSLVGARAIADDAKELPVTDLAVKVAEEIRAEALRSPLDKEGRPFPLAATWAPGSHNFSPEYQVGLINRGHHLLLCFGWPPSDSQFGGEDAALPRYVEMRREAFRKNFEPALRFAARLKLPICFQRFQFEMELTSDKRYQDLPADKNPGVIGLDGTVQRVVDPMSPIEPWGRLGREHVTSMCMRLAQEIYPDPPLVIFLSNNEHPVLDYHNAEKSKRFVDAHGQGTDSRSRAEIFAAALTAHYRALQQGMRDGLVSPEWQKNVRFFAYEAFGPRCLGRYGGWRGDGRFEPESGRMIWVHRAWDGGSPSYYTDDWAGFLTDHTSSSVQVEAMNWLFMLRDAHAENPDFWFEYSTWDGDQYGVGGKRSQHAGRGGQIYDADRYQGMLQFGLWLMRPRALRDFRYLESLEYAEPYFLANVKAVEQVYASPLLRKFWRQGELVANHGREHPYTVALTEAVKKQDRWYLLSTDLDDPKKEWGLYTEIPVFSLALGMGEEPRREWLVFAHAPRGARTDVGVKLPGFGDIRIDAPVTGAFYHVKEQDRSTACVVPGGPADATPVVSVERPQVGQEIVFEATNVYAPGGRPLELTWDFSDGTRATGGVAKHAFAKRGLYVVALTARDADGSHVTRRLPVPVGYPDRDGCLLHLPLDRSPHVGVATERVQIGKLDWFPEFLGLVFASNTRAFCGLSKDIEWVDDEARGEVLRLPDEGSYVALHPFFEVEFNSAIPQYDALGRNRTISLWFKADDVTRRQVIYQDGSANADILNLYLDGGELRAGAWSANRKDWPGTWLSTPVEAGTWHHVALTLADADPAKPTGSLRLFLDGKPVAQGTAFLNRPFWARLGGYWSTRFHDGSTAKRSPSMVGCVDDCAVFYRVLPDAEIAERASE